jgi:hypothetical protein
MAVDIEVTKGCSIEGIGFCICQCRLCGFASSRSTDASAAQQIVSGDAFSDEASTRAGAPDLSERNRVPSAVSTVGGEAARCLL